MERSGVSKETIHPDKRLIADALMMCVVYLCYGSYMKVSSAEFRENLFQIIDRALHGEFVEVVHKGRVLRLLP